MSKEKIYKLHEIPKYSRIKAETTDDKGNVLGDFIVFGHLDGMYSYCWVEGHESEICHLGCMQTLKKVEDYYILV